MDRYYQVTAADADDIPDLISAVAGILEYFEDEYLEGKIDIEIKGAVEQAAAKIPGITEHRWAQLQELEAIVLYLQTIVKKAKQRAFKHYLENYNRQLTSRDAQTYADADDDVLNKAEILNQVSFMRNKFIGIYKSIEAKHWQLNNITKLRAAGLEDAYIDYD